MSDEKEITREELVTLESHVRNWNRLTGTALQDARTDLLYAAPKLLRAALRDVVRREQEAGPEYLPSSFYG